MPQLQVLNISGLGEIQPDELSKIDGGFIRKYWMENYLLFACDDNHCYGVKIVKNGVGGEVWQMKRLSLKIYR